LLNPFDAYDSPDGAMPIGQQCLNLIPSAKPGTSITEPEDIYHP